MRHHVDEAVTHRRPHGPREADTDELGRLAGAGHVARGRSAGAAAGERGLLALQRAAGSRAVVQLMRAGRPVVQRCGCGGCATCGPARDDDRPGQGVEGAEEEFPAPAQGVVQRSTGPVPLQRAANFAAGPVHQVNNLAGAVVNGTPAGVTWPTLNGTQFWSNAAAGGHEGVGDLVGGAAHGRPQRRLGGRRRRAVELGAAAVVAYHGSAAGGPIGAPTGPGSRNHCAISWAKYTNPS
jgi:hypothetical protein